MKNDKMMRVGVVGAADGMHCARRRLALSAGDWFHAGDYSKKRSWVYSASCRCRAVALDFNAAALV